MRAHRLSHKQDSEQKSCSLSVAGDEHGSTCSNTLPCLVGRSCTFILRISLRPENQVVYHRFPRGERKRYGRHPPCPYPLADSSSVAGWPPVSVVGTQPSRTLPHPTSASLQVNMDKNAKSGARRGNAAFWTEHGGPQPKSRARGCEPYPARGALAYRRHVFLAEPLSFWGPVCSTGV
jgi:hypothetical protein